MSLCMSDRIIAVGLLTRRDLKLLGPTFDRNWQAPKNQSEAGSKLAATYHIKTGHLTDCTICHR